MLLLAICEGANVHAVNSLVQMIDPNALFKLMINLIKRLYVKTKYTTPKDTEKWMNHLKKKGLLKEHKNTM